MSEHVDYGSFCVLVIKKKHCIEEEVKDLMYLLSAWWVSFTYTEEGRGTLVEG